MIVKVFNSLIKYEDIILSQQISKPDLGVIQKAAAKSF